jgi:hypothetical protein
MTADKPLTPGQPPAGEPAPRPGLGRVLLFGVAAAVAAAAVVAIVAFIEVQVFEIEDTFQPLWPPAAASITVLYVMIGTGVLAVVSRMAADPRRAFVRIALLGLALSFIPQVLLLVSGVEMPMGEFTPKNVLVLSSLHLVAAVVALPIMLRVFRT